MYALSGSPIWINTRILMGSVPPMVLIACPERTVIRRVQPSPGNPSSRYDIHGVSAPLHPKQDKYAWKAGTYSEHIRAHVED